jgi:hypothetical protein
MTEQAVEPLEPNRTHLASVEVRDALMRVVQSDPFRGAPQLVAFLSFVVTRTLDGQTDSIKGYTIATQALGRSEDFDPQIDPIVRVEAMRLRKSLEAYYAGSGATDPVRITIPRGNYIPIFEHHSPFHDSPGLQAAAQSSQPPSLVFVWLNRLTKRPLLPRGFATRAALGGLALFVAALALLLATSSGRSLVLGNPVFSSFIAPQKQALPGTMKGVRLPTVYVKPIRIKGETLPRHFSEWLRERILLDLSRFDEIITLRRDDSRHNPDGYTLTVQGVPESGNVSFEASLSHDPTGQVIWSRDLKKRLEQDSASRLEHELSREIVTVLAQPHGIIFSDLRVRHPNDPRLACLIEAHDYFYAPSSEEHARLRECLERAVAEADNFHSGFAALTFLILEEVRAGFNPRPETLERALRSARRAVDLAPESARAHQALMAALFTRGDREDALKIGERALDLNPLDSSVPATLGSRYLWAGRYEDALVKLQEAAAMNPGRPAWYDLYIFFAAFMRDQNEIARSAALKLVGMTPLSLVGQILAAQIMKDETRIRTLYARLIAIAPEYGQDPRVALTRNGFMTDMVERVAENLRKAHQLNPGF